MVTLLLSTTGIGLTPAGLRGEDSCELTVLDREATAAALGLGPEYPGSSESERSSTIHGSNGSLTKDGGCTMFSSPGYGFGESLSFSSGC